MRRPLSSIERFEQPASPLMVRRGRDHAVSSGGGRRDREQVAPAGRARGDRKPRRILAGSSIEAIPVTAVCKVEFLLFRGGDEQGVNRFRAVAALQVAPVGGRRDRGRDRDDRERDHQLDQGKAGGGTSLRHEVLTGSPE